MNAAAEVVIDTNIVLDLFVFEDPSSAALRAFHRGLAHRRAVTVEATRFAGEQAVDHVAEPHGTHRLLFAAAARPRDARHGHAHRRARMTHRTESHRTRDDFAHRAMRFNLRS